MNTKTLFPSWTKLNEDVKRLKAELPLLILERDDLILVKCVNIKTIYMLKLGALEYKVYENECALLRARRKIQLIQAKINREEKINIKNIETILDTEFKEYQAKLNEKIDEINTAIEHNKGEFLTKEEALEIKKLYSLIVKALHPDLNKDLGSEKIQLFYNAVNAYKNGDINTIRLISVMLEDNQEIKDLSSNELEKEKAKLESIIEEIHKTINETKSSFPYTMKEVVEDEEKIEEIKNDLEINIEQLQDAIKACNERIEELLETK